MTCAYKTNSNISGFVSQMLVCSSLSACVSIATDTWQRCWQSDKGKLALNSPSSEAQKGSKFRDLQQMCLRPQSWHMPQDLSCSAWSQHCKIFSESSPWAMSGSHLNLETHTSLQTESNAAADARRVKSSKRKMRVLLRLPRHPARTNIDANLQRATCALGRAQRSSVLQFVQGQLVPLEALDQLLS